MLEDMDGSRACVAKCAERGQRCKLGLFSGREGMRGMELAFVAVRVCNIRCGHGSSESCLRQRASVFPHRASCYRRLCASLHRHPANLASPVVLTVRRCQELSLTALHPHIRSYSPATTTPKCHTTSQCSQHLPVSLSGAANVIFPSFHSQHWQGHPSYLKPDALHPVLTVVSTCSK